MIFSQICAIKWTKVKWCIGKVFYHFTIFGLKNAKKNFFEENKGFERSFYELKYTWFQIPLPDLEKHQICIFLLINENNQLHILKSVYAFYFT